MLSALRHGHAQQLNRASAVIVHAKKKSKKKKESGDDQEETRRAPRIRTDAPISVRKQITIVRFYEEQQRKAQVPQAAKRGVPGYRKAAGVNSAKDLEELREAAAQRKARASRQRVEEASLDAVYGSRGKLGATVLLVDGYNLLPHHKGLCKLREKSLQMARDKLESMLAQYSAHVNCCLTVVWDAMGSEETTAQGFQSSNKGGIGVVYTTSREADSFIVQAVRLLRAAGHSEVLVATSDTEFADLAREEHARVVKCNRLMMDIHNARRQEDSQRRELNVRSDAIKATTGSARFTVSSKTLETRADEVKALLAGFDSAQDHAAAQALDMDRHAFYDYMHRLWQQSRREKRKLDSSFQGSSESDSD